MLTETRMSRARLFVLIDAFENDMRQAVEKYLLDHLDEEAILGVDFADANKIRESDVEDDPVPIVHYLYLRQCYDILNRNRLALPVDLADEIRANTPKVDSVAPIRNRVMHGRPLRPDDPENAVSALSGFTSRHWIQTRETLKRLADDPAWEPAFETLELSTESVLHNLPPADYDETGLIGRTEDVGQLVKLLKSRRDTMITVTGEGGIGKTALALDAAYQLVDDVECPFECVIWISLKREMLTAYGVRDIASAFRDLTAATDSMGQVLDNSFSGSLRELSDMLQGIATLLIIDNLESAQGSEVIGLYDSLPRSVSYLFTSRLGIGEIERRYPLGPLKEQYAAQLFRKFALRRGQRQLARLSQSAIKAVVIDNLRSSPLAIRWYILSVEAGNEPASTLRAQDELLNFCVKNVYDALSPGTRIVLGILDSIEHSVSFSELAVLSEQPIDDLRKAIQELSRGALVSHEADPSGGLSSRISVSPTAHMFLPSQPSDAPSTTEIMRREQSYLSAVERRRAEESDRLLGPNTVRVRGPEDEPAAHLLRMALSTSRRGDMSAAQGFIDRARSLNPDFWECDRVDAFIASTQQQRERAATLYRSALSRADSPESRAVVSHFFAGHLARAMKEPELALPYAEEAHELFRNSDTALAYGNLLVWNGRFAEGQELLEVSADESEGRTKLIALTGVVESWRRWGDDLAKNRQPLDSFDKASAGFSIGAEAIAKGLYDLRLAEATVEAAYTAVRATLMPGVRTRAVEGRLKKIMQQLAGEAKLYVSSRTWKAFRAALRRWLENGHLRGDTRELGNYLINVEASGTGSRAAGVATPNNEDDRLIGEVISWAGRYGFIRHAEYAENIFFHRGSLQEPEANAIKLTRGAAVYFEVSQDESGRVRANRVSLVGEATPASS